MNSYYAYLVFKIFERRNSYSEPTEATSVNGYPSFVPENKCIGIFLCWEYDD